MKTFKTTNSISDLLQDTIIHSGFSGVRYIFGVFFIGITSYLKCPLALPSDTGKVTYREFQTSEIGTKVTLDQAEYIIGLNLQTAFLVPWDFEL